MFSIHEPHTINWRNLGSCVCEAETEKEAISQALEYYQGQFPRDNQHEEVWVVEYDADGNQVSMKLVELDWRD